VLAEARRIDPCACLLLEVAREGVSGTSSVFHRISVCVVRVGDCVSLERMDRVELYLRPAA
jgi:hypothetical protein